MTRTSPPPTLGVEEEFALLDPDTGAVSLVADAVVAGCDDAVGVGPESMRYMVETRTPVCGTLDEVATSLADKRQQVAAEATRQGALLVSSGVAPFGVPRPPPLTPDPRYAQLLDTFPDAMSTTGTCSCHVHVGIPDRDGGVAVVRGLGPWLPLLAALTANSPVWAGRDCGWASTRHLFVTKWPTAIPCPPVEVAEGYDEVVRTALAQGRALDVRSVYFFARLSPRYPTVEVRVADACLTVDESVAYAGLVRALAAAALEGGGRGSPAVDATQEQLAACCYQAARRGMDGPLIDPATLRPVDAWQHVDALLDVALPHLESFGDADRVVGTLEVMRRAGNGAQRQRRLFRTAAGTPEFVAALARAGSGTWSVADVSRSPRRPAPSPG